MYRVDELLPFCVAYSSNSHFEQKMVVNMDIPSFTCNGTLTLNYDRLSPEEALDTYWHFRQP